MEMMIFLDHPLSTLMDLHAASREREQRANLLLVTQGWGLTGPLALVMQTMAERELQASLAGRIQRMQGMEQN